MKITILSQFPEMFSGVTTESILGKAKEKGILDINILNIRDYTTDKHLRTDDTPFGGGAGMVMQCQPAFDALNSVNAKEKHCIYMSPRGKVLCQEMIESMAKEEELVILCGHYEGIDQRIIDTYNMEEISIGDYVLTGGELAAMVLVDSVSRLVPGVLGSSESLLEESIYSGLLEYPQYTKPREYEGINVPEVLFSGDHKAIKNWQWEESLKLTKERRPDLFENYINRLGKLTKDETEILSRVINEDIKKKELFEKQKKLLDTFLEKKAISKAQYDKSLGDLKLKMNIKVNK